MGEEVAAVTPEVTPATPPSVGNEVVPEQSDTTVTPEGAWFGDFDDDSKSYLAAKGWDKEGKGPGDVLKSYRELEKMRGVDADKLLVMPDKENAEEMSAFFQKLGVPDSPEGYNTAPVDVNGLELDTAIVDKLSHGLNHTPEQHAKFVQDVSEYFGNAMVQEAQVAVDRDAVEKQTLEGEWGALATENYAIAGKAATRFGVDTETMDKIQQGLGYRGTVELFAQIGRAFGEGKAPAEDRAAESAPFGVTPTVAKDSLDGLSKDKGFRDKLFSGDTAAKDEWDRLKKLAFQG